MVEVDKWLRIITIGVLLLLANSDNTQNVRLYTRNKSADVDVKVQYSCDIA